MAVPPIKVIHTHSRGDGWADTRQLTYDRGPMAALHLGSLWRRAARASAAEVSHDVNMAILATLLFTVLASLLFGDPWPKFFVLTASTWALIIFGSFLRNIYRSARGRSVNEDWLAEVFPTETEIIFGIKAGTAFATVSRCSGSAAK